MKVATTHDRIAEFLTSVTGQEIHADTNLQDSNLIDSLTMMDLLVFFESEFGVRLDFEDLTPEFFQSPATISRLLDTDTSFVRN